MFVMVPLQPNGFQPLFLQGVQWWFKAVLHTHTLSPPGVSTVVSSLFVSVTFLLQS